MSINTANPIPGIDFNPQSYRDNPRLCKACGQELFPNFMEGSWEHFAPGCIYSGKSQMSTPNGVERMPPFNGFADFAGDWKYPK